MGLEAECTVKVGRKAFAGKAFLEGQSLIFRGDQRFEIPFEGIREVGTENGTLVVTTDEQETRFELGPEVASQWMRRIKEPKSVLEKLELGPDSRVALVDVNDALFLAAVRGRVASVVEGRVPQGTSIIFFGVETRETLRKLQLLRARLVDSGILWIVRPKASKTVSEGDVLGAARDAGLVDTKVVAFSGARTAHKFVIPLEMRGQARRRPPIQSIPPSEPALGSTARSKPGAGSKAKQARTPAASGPPAAGIPNKKDTPGPKKRR